MTAAGLLALAGAFCFGAAAALQQREAGRAAELPLGDLRLLWRLAHRPLWLAGVLADALAAGLHVLALAFGPISLVQPIGVTGLLFAVLLVAAINRRRLRAADIGAAFAVLLALAVFLGRFPAQPRAGRIPGPIAVVVAVAATVGVAALLAGCAQLVSGRLRPVLLAAGAGTAFGTAAVLARVVVTGPGLPVVLLAVGGALVVVVAGYLLLQNAYRSGFFEGTLATAVVLDPVAALIGGAAVLGETMPAGPAAVTVSACCGLVIFAGVTALVRSPAHVFRLATPADAPAAEAPPHRPPPEELPRLDSNQ